MARVRGVTSSASLAASRFGLAAVLSANTMRAPRSTNALGVLTNVYEGTMTSSPGCKSSSNAAISSASVQLVVSSTLAKPSCCSKYAWHFFVNTPSPEILPERTASSM